MAYHISRNKSDRALAKLTKARSLLVLDHHFFAHLALRLKLKEFSKEEIASGAGTMATDGIRVLYNPDFVLKTPKSQLAGVIAHEAFHCGLLHQMRLQGRDPRKWNVACDLAINPILISGGLELPEDALYEKQFAGISAELIYNRIPHTMKLPEWGSVITPKGDDAKEAESIWSIAITQAAQQAKAMGKLPSDIETLVNGITNPKIDWLEFVRRFFDSLTKDDYTWTLPNRRHIGRGIYLPSEMSKALIRKIIIAVDSSASVSQSMLNEFCGNFSSILEDINVLEMVVICCDAKVHSYQSLTKDDLPLSIKIKGRGGTSFKPVFKWVEDNAQDPSCLIYFTDLEGSFPKTEPDYPVLWAVKSIDAANKIPFGETVVID